MKFFCNYVHIVNIYVSLMMRFIRVIIYLIITNGIIIGSGILSVRGNLILSFRCFLRYELLLRFFFRIIGFFLRKKGINYIYIFKTIFYDF